MDLLITVLIWAILFAVIAYAALWVCARFFPEFPPARWIAGALLLILLLVGISRIYPSAFTHLR